MPKTKTTTKNSAVKKVVKKINIRTIGEDLFVSDGKYTIRVGYSESSLKMSPTNSERFIFVDDNDKETIKRWKAVLELMKAGLSYLEGAVTHGK